MPTRAIFIALSVITLTAFFVTRPAGAQSRVYGTLEAIRSTGPCGFDINIPTDSSISRVASLWFMFDRADRNVSARGLELLGGSGRYYPNNFVTSYEIIPGTLFAYTSRHYLTGWNHITKTVTMLKESWIYTGWGAETRIYCYGAWAAQVKYS